MLPTRKRLKYRQRLSSGDSADVSQDSLGIMIYTFLTEELARSQVAELQAAIAAIPADSELARSILNKEIAARERFLTQEENDRRLREAAAIAARNKPQTVGESPKYSPEQLEKLLKDFLHRRSMLVNQLESTLPGYRHLIQDRLDELDRQIANLQAQLDQAQEVPA